MSTQFSLDWQLFLAARTGDMESAREALRAGANPNFVHHVGKRPTSQNATSVLLRAASTTSVQFVEMLLDSGATIPESKDAQRRLAYATHCSDSPSVLELLLNRGLAATRQDADWAKRKGYGELVAMIERSIGKYSITYDIDALIREDCFRFYPKFCESIPDYSSIHDPELLPHERVIRDLWEFCCDTGSGFSALIGNAHYDTVSRVTSALKEIRHSTASVAVGELREILAKYGFPESSDGALGHLSELDENASAAMEAEISELDRKYFYTKDGAGLWDKPDYLDYGIDYVRENIQEFRKRKRAFQETTVRPVDGERLKI